MIRGHARVFDAYRPWLADANRALDWGCRHAPDACLMRADRGSTITIDGCDVFEPGAYDVFHRYVGLRYRRVVSSTRLPYEDDAFDTVVPSAVLEHVPMDYESLKELHRVLREHGRLIVT